MLLSPSLFLKHNIIPFLMGQVSEASAQRAVTPEELQLIHEGNQVYLNIRNQRMYLRNNIVLADLGDFQYQLDIYEFRRLNQMFLVSVDYCSNIKEPQICSSFNRLTYYIEKQEYTLFQKTTASIQQGLNILLHSLQGFRILYEKFGYFTPNSRLVFFNRNHEPRVWLNSRLQTTKNLQNPNGPKNIILQNTFVRQIVHLFDGLRDPLCPMFRYSDFLPMNFLSFGAVEEILHKKQMEVVAQRQSPFTAFRQIQNIRKQSKKQLSIKDLVFCQKSQPISCRNSPMNSPRNSKMIEVSKREYDPPMNFVYQTPPKQQTFEYPSQQHEQIKLATKMSLKNTIQNGRSAYQQQNYMKQSPSTIPASTMPASRKNSGVFEKCIIIEKLDASPINSSNINVSTINCQHDNKSLKQQAAQRYSEAEKPMISFQVSPLNKRLKVSLEQKASLLTNQMERDDPKQFEHNEAFNQSSNNFVEKRMNNNQSGPNFAEGARHNFQHHKRHQTDFKMLSKMSSNQSRANQTSMVDGNYLSKFNLNTIKSIHLLDEDRQLDRDIIVDLKQIINKYRKLG